MNNVVGFLLFCFTVVGASSADDPPEQVYAYVGVPAVLPCRQNLRYPEDPTIEWSKPDLHPSEESKRIVLLYRGYDEHDGKHKDFQFRTHLFMTEVKHGNYSMRLSDVRETDEGRYVCRTRSGNTTKEINKLELVVDEIPKPELSVVSSGTGEVTLRCAVRACFSTEPRLTFQEAHGSALTEGKPTITKKGEGSCYSLEQQVMLPTTAKSVVCRVDFTEINQSREIQMLIPENNPCTVPMVIIGTVSLVLVLASLGFGILINKCCRNSGEKTSLIRQSSDETTSSGRSETRPFLQQDSTSIDMEAPQSSSVASPPPDLLCSTPSSTVSVEDIPMEEFQMNDRNRRKTLPRQDALNDILPPKSLSKSDCSLPSVISKSPTKRCPVTRSRSVSDSCSVTLVDFKIQYRRQSVSAAKDDTGKLLQKVQEELETDTSF